MVNFIKDISDKNLLSLREYLKSEKLNSSPYSIEELLSVLGIGEKVSFDELQGIIEKFKKSDNPEVHYYVTYLENLFLSYKVDYIDSITEFGNRNKLKEDIDRKNFPENNNLVRLKIRKIGDIDIAYGEENTDYIIKEIGKKIKEEFGVSCIYKMYGSEFAVVVNDDFSSINRKIDYIEDSDINLGGLEIQVKINASVVSLASDYSNSEDLLHKSFTALHTSRNSSDVVFFDEKVHNHKYEKENILWTKKVEDILKYDIEKLDEDSGFLPYFQKIVKNLNSENKKIWKFECLARMSDINNGEIYGPGLFLDSLDKCGKSYYLTKIIIQKSLSEMKKYNLLENSIISFNLTGNDILEDDFIDFLIFQTDKFGILKENIILEIVEDTEYYQSVINKLELLKSLGFKIAVDDFGISNSSFWNFIKNLKNFDFLKIDKKFVWSLSNQNVKDTIKNFIDLAHNNGIEIVAEGVESEETQNTLKEMGVDYSQGFYFSKPSRLKDII